MHVYIDEANERYQMIPYTEFYNDAVNEQLDIKEDFPHFKDRKGYDSHLHVCLLVLIACNSITLRLAPALRDFPLDT